MNSIEKYGLENFEVNKVFDVAFSKDELNIKEVCWISYYKSYDRKYGYNIEKGGSNSPISEITKEKMRNSSLPTQIDYILQIDKNDNIINKFKSYQLASDKTGIPRCQITNNVIDEKKTCHGYVFIRESKYNENFKNPLKKKKNIVKIKTIYPRTKRIVCLNTLEVFSSIKEASIKYKIDSSSITKNCKHKSTYCGILPNGEKAIWLYYNEYKDMSKKEIKEISKKVKGKTKKVICLTTNKIFQSIKEASNFYRCSNSKIVEVCKNRRKYCGVSGDKTKLTWMYYDEYLNSLI